MSIAEPTEEITPADLVIDARHLRYFIEDEDLFTPPAKPKSGLAIATPMVPTPQDRKRIIVIRRASSHDTTHPARRRAPKDDNNAAG